MEKLIDEGHGTTALLAGLVIILCLHFFYKIGHFIWELNNKKHEVTEESIKNLSQNIASNTSAQHSLEERLRSVENQLGELTKFKVDIRHLIEAIKHLAGDKWPDIRKIIIEDKFPT